MPAPSLLMPSGVDSACSSAEGGHGLLRRRTQSASHRDVARDAQPCRSPGRRPAGHLRLGMRLSRWLMTVSSPRAGSAAVAAPMPVAAPVTGAVRRRTGGGGVPSQGLSLRVGAGRRALFCGAFVRSPPCHGRHPEPRHRARPRAAAQRARQPARGGWRIAALNGSRSVKEAWQAAWLVRTIQCLDLTTLAGDDTPGRVRRPLRQARRPLR